MGLTYWAKRSTVVGSTNTGVILFRSVSNSTIRFFEMIRGKIPNKVHDGGGNQKAIDRLVPHLKYEAIYALHLDQFKHYDKDGQVRILALQFPGPLNYHSSGCRTLPPNIYVAHFKALKKNWALSSDCRDAAFPLTTGNQHYTAYRGVWKESCECARKGFFAFCWPSSNATQKGASWCST